MTQTEALKLALEALEKSIDNSAANTQHTKAIAAIKEALAQPEQEPIGEVVTAGVICWKDKYPSLGTKLYTTPPQRKPMTGEKINARAKAEGANNADFWAGVRFAEAEHCIKE